MSQVLSMCLLTTGGEGLDPGNLLYIGHMGCSSYMFIVFKEELAIHDVL